MSDYFSAHLINSYMASRAPCGPFGQPAPPVSSFGPMTFAPTMHGSLTQQTNASAVSDSYMSSLTEEAEKKIALLQAKLDKKLGPEFVSQRPGPAGGPKLTYAEGWKIINLANNVFGFNGWSSSVVNLTTDFIDFNEETKRYTVGVTAVVRVTLRDGVFHEDIGYGMLENSKSKGAALDKCKKEAVTDGVKRSLRNFGNLLGNCLYDKSYAQEVVKIKVQPPKFNKDDLYRRPEFDPNLNSLNPSNDRSEVTNPQVKQGPMPPPPPRAPSAIPPHARVASGPTSVTTPIKTESVVSPAGKSTEANVAALKTGLPTPIRTPAHLQFQQPQNPAVSRAPPQNRPPETKVDIPANQPRRVPLAKEPPESVSLVNIDNFPAEDESFGMHSDDEEFFAGVDLEAEEALAEYLDEGLGGHIDFDEDIHDGKGDSTYEHPRLPSPPPAQRLEQKDTTRFAPPSSQVRQAALRQQQQQEAQVNRQLVAETREDQQQNMPPPPPPRRHQTTVPNHERSDNASSDSSTGSTKRDVFVDQQARMGTAGRFRPASTLQSSQSGVASSSIGIKRSADMMQTTAAPHRRLVQGMGLTHQSSSGVPNTNTGRPTGAYHARREPLATLHSEEYHPDGGDMKRIRR